jgi:uncharacterized protein
VKINATLMGLGLIVSAGFGEILQAQEMTVEAYQPRSTLVVPGKVLTRARFPFVDVHGHQRATRMTPEEVTRLVGEMDELNLRVMVNLSGGSGERLVQGLAALQGPYPDRFVFFANVDWSGVGESGWGTRAAAQLEADVEAGASGLKVFKGLGMTNKDADGNRIAVDDPRLGPVWEKAGELGIPVLIHSADPAEFWQPHDANNERWLELKLRPRRIRRPGEYPPFEQIIAEQHDMFRSHPNTTFISAHLSWMGNDLGRLGELLDEIPNMNVGLGAVIYELGRQPRFGNEWLTKYADRVLMGKDSYKKEEFYTYFRVFESSDDYFPYYRKYHAFWSMYGLGLSDDVLRKIYYENAVRLIPGITMDQFQ